MKVSTLAPPRPSDLGSKPTFLDTAARRLVRGQLERLERGALTLVENDRAQRFGTPNAAAPAAEIRVRNASFYADVAFGGSIGAAEAYARGSWQSPDLVSLVRLLLANRNVLDGMERGTARLTRPLRQAFHWINRNTRAGARRNIAAHYDLGNDFFALWLDESMMYSSAVFASDDMSLADAQHHRLDLICDRLALAPGDHVVEIGTGWGGFAMHAARTRGCRVTTTTISAAQHALATARIAEAGLADRIDVELKDYRDLEGRYDKLVSIEMIEAIGSAQYDTYFAKCANLLKPGGRMLIQAITIADQHYEAARREVDFIKRYIFPGSNIPGLAVMIDAIARVTPMRVSLVEDIGLHYARTLNHWRRNFLARIDAVRALGYSEEFIRMWEFYFAYCEGGFLERAIGDVHLVADKPV